MKKFTFLIAALLIIFFGCSKNPDRALQDAIARYKTGEVKTPDSIKKELINKTSAGVFSSKGLQSNGNFLYYLYEDSLKIIYPFEKTFEPINSGKMSSFDLNQDFFTFCDGLHIKAENLKSRAIKNINPPDEKIKIEAHTLMNDTVIYYMDSKLMVDELSSDKSGFLVKDQFTPPYNKYYNIYIEKINNKISLLLGAAGSYYLSIIDAESASTIVKNITLSSSKYFINNNDAYYILGSTGSWELMKFNIIKKTKKPLKKFRDIIDIELSSFGFIIETSDGLTIEDYDSGEKIEIPFEYRLNSRLGEYILMEYSGKTYLVDLKSLYDNLQTIKAEIPGLFKQ